MATQDDTRHVNGQDAPVQIDEDAAMAFEALREERAALDPQKLVQINADIPTAATIALGSFQRLRSLRASVVNELPKHEMRHWDGLQTYALAALHAHVVSMVPDDSDDRARVKRLLDEAVPLRKKLLVAAEAIAHAGVFDADRVAQIRSGAGHMDRGVDLIALCALYTERWAEVENRTMVTKEEVQRAGVLGPALLEALGAKRLANTRLPAAELRDDRARAFTLLVRAYETCQQAVAYLRFREGDAGAYAPSLRPRPRTPQPRRVGGGAPRASSSSRPHREREGALFVRTTSRGGPRSPGSAVPPSNGRVQPATPTRCVTRRWPVVQQAEPALRDRRAAHQHHPGQHGDAAALETETRDQPGARPGSTAPADTIATAASETAAHDGIPADPRFRTPATALAAQTKQGHVLASCGPRRAPLHALHRAPAFSSIGEPTGRGRSEIDVREKRRDAASLNGFNLIAHSLPVLEHLLATGCALQLKHAKLPDLRSPDYRTNDVTIPNIASDE
jgi:hypothetical protein